MVGRIPTYVITAFQRVITWRPALLQNAAMRRFVHAKEKGAPQGALF
ncbi:MAG: hypothetical protein ACJASC_000290 [Limimaricola cinnabarinus]|jgi:hypothetical protein